MENKFAPPPKKSEPTIISPKSFSKPQEPVKTEEAQQPKTDYKKINSLPGMHIEADNEEEPEENDDDWDDDEEEAAQPPLPSRNVASGAPVQKEEPEQEEIAPSLPSRNSIPAPKQEEAPEQAPEEEIEEEAEEAAPQLPSRSSAAPPPPPRRATPEEKAKGKSLGHSRI